MPREREAASGLLNVIARSTCDDAIQFLLAALDCFASLAMTMPRQSPSRRLPRRIESGIDAALEACEGFQALLVHEREQLHHDHAGDVACGVDPVISVGKARPGEAAGAA